MAHTLTENAPLAARTTFRVPAHAAWLADVEDAGAVPEVLALPQAAPGVLVLGEGSNTLFTRDFDGLVLHPDIRGIEVLADGGVRAGAGENWHAFVRWTLARGYAGLENLVLIPGTVGAAPIQNIGAYGTELDEFIAGVHAYDRVSRMQRVLSRDACGFSYRDSVFKRERDRYIVTAVEFRLPRERPLMLDYAGVRDELAAMGVAAPLPTDVADAVERLRRRKLPDPAEIGNAGSFFKNPVVAGEVAARLTAEYPKMPLWHGVRVKRDVWHGVRVKRDGLRSVPFYSDPECTFYSDPECKLSAAWLLEQCGFKGARDGDAGFSERHALVLVNHGNAKGVELWALAQRAQAEVERKFGVVLEPEPRVI